MGSLPLQLGTVVLQPTTLCNMNCSYCYLPDRRIKAFMSDDVVARVAEVVGRQRKRTYVLWHGGEPLATGVARFERHLERFRRSVSQGICQHSLQTNATLINDYWCRLFKSHGFKVGVSVDGDQALNAARAFWNGRPAYSAAARGIACLRKFDIPFGVIAVVNSANVASPLDFYEGLLSLNPVSISINVEEAEGANVGHSHVRDGDTRAFWMGLYQAWRANPQVPIRQFSDVVSIMRLVSRGGMPKLEKERNLYPTIDVNGNVFLLSPEFAAAPAHVRHTFMVGNILQDDLEEIIQKSRTHRYVAEFFVGVERCRETCEYFLFCGGGQASNKFYETGNLMATETRYCRNAKIYPAETVLNALEGGITS
ncbi:MAG TPA: radical SAM protein [Burkholderiales bacterium]|nr:radical SAM protein [Burkholderiales bacterium]